MRNHERIAHWPVRNSVCGVTQGDSNFCAKQFCIHTTEFPLALDLLFLGILVSFSLFTPASVPN